MAANPAYPISRWPFRPSWVLEGFDFSAIPVAFFRSAIKVLHRRDFTTGLSNPRHPSELDYCRMVATNLKLQFRAMLYCRDVYNTPRFWERVHHCSLRQGNLGQVVEELFVQARKAYLQSTGGCPNDAARVVDEWIAFVESGPAAQPSDATPWHLRFAEWNVTMLGARPANTQLGGLPPLGIHTNGLVVKREDTPDDASVVELSSARADKPTSKRKRNQSEGLGTPRSQSRPSKRRETEPHNADEPTQNEQHEPLSSPQHGTPGRKSTKARLDKCEEKAAEHINLLHAQYFRLAKQEELVAMHTTEIEELDSRLKSVEASQSPNQEFAPGQGGNQRRGQEQMIEQLQQSLADVTDRLNNRDSYIRAEIKKQLAAIHSPLEQEQSRVAIRVEGFRDDLAVQRVRNEDCQKAVDEHIKKGKDEREGELSTLETSLDKKMRTRNRKLSARIDELEETLKNNNTSAKSEHEDMSEKRLSRLEADVAAVKGRLTKLEMKQANQERARKQSQNAAIEPIHRRLNAIESGNSQGKTGSSHGKKGPKKK